jgi:acyl-CoA reductase-like NAD-dependent aldehyde dehydrogenase
MAGKREHLGRQIAREGGKPLTDALIEVDRAIAGVRNAVDELRVRAGREIPMGLTAASDDRHAFTMLEPIGVVAAISAFNHPLNLIIHQVVPAIAVGCPVIVKPAIATPLSCVDFVAMVHEAGLPEAWCQTFLPETNELAGALATDPRIAFLSFIGSSRVGWHLRSKLPPGTRCALEHGGAAPVIIDRSADLNRVIEPLAKGGYYHAGQVCVSVQRIFVNADREATLLDRFAARVSALKVGDPQLAETEVGPLIAPREADRVSAWIDEAVSGGAWLMRRARERHDDQALDPRQSARRCQGLDARSVRPGDLRLPVHAARRRDRRRERTSLGVPGQRLHGGPTHRLCRFRASRRLGRHGQ